MLDNAMKDLEEEEEIVLRVEKDPLIGKKLAGRYEIVSVLGRGGMGVVYKAHQTDVDRFVAIKTLHISKIADSHVIQKFRSEAQAVSRVRHPNTVTLYDFGVSQEGVPFLVMDILDGVSFRDVLKESGALPLGRVNSIFQQVCAALAFAHETGIVHKDLKPENIMLCDRPGQPDWVYVLDFGIAGLLESKEQQVTEIVGSPPYMSPEQCSMQGGADHRSDIYSLGICVFEALSGKFPFKARTAMEMLDCHMNQKPMLLKDVNTKLSTFESLSLVIAKALEKKPEKRQQNIHEFAAELDDAIKKDSKRGMQLRARATMEFEAAPKAIDPVKSEPVIDEEKSEELVADGKNARPKGIVDNLKALIQGESAPGGDSLPAEEPEKTDNDKKYHFETCPHCDAPTEVGISLCLACGRSLAAKNDFSKIRASRGDFTLPKYHELSPNPANAAPKGFSQKSRTAMLNNSRTWTAGPGLLLISIVLFVCMFFAAGGGQYLMNMMSHNNSAAAQPSDGAPAPAQSPAPTSQ
jgi:serine/threonine protein kinase